MVRHAEMHGRIPARLHNRNRSITDFIILLRGVVGSSTSSYQQYGGPLPSPLHNPAIMTPSAGKERAFHSERGLPVGERSGRYRRSRGFSQMVRYQP